MKQILNKLKEPYEKKYKKLLLIPIILLILSISLLGYSKITTGEYIEKDVSLTGGITVTVYTSENIDINSVKTSLESQLNTEVKIRELTSIANAGTLGYTFEMQDIASEEEIIDTISSEINIEITSENSSIEQTSATLGASFFRSSMTAIIFAFIFMAIVVFFYFRKIVVSGAIILSVIFDVLVTLGIMNIIGIKLSTISIAALLMIIGYSVDTDILLSSKILKSKKGTITERIYRAMNTGLTMQFTTLVVFLVMFFLSPAIALKEIAIILIISIFIDIISTWIQNAGILRLFLEKKHE